MTWKVTEALNVRNFPTLDPQNIVDELAVGDLINEVDLTGWCPIEMDDSSIGVISRKFLVMATAADLAPKVVTPVYPASAQTPMLQAVKYFVAQGWKDFQAAAIVGNLMQESNLKPTAVNSSSGAYGIAQWLGSRLDALHGQANWSTLQAQLAFVQAELNGPEQAAADALRATTTLADATMTVRTKYERCGESEAADANRLAQAKIALSLATPAAAVTVAPAEPPWIVLSRNYLGTKEAAGSADNPTIVGWDKLMTTLPASLDHDATPWCAIFVHAMLLLSGYKGKIVESALAVDWLGFGVPVTDPRDGDIVVFDFGGGDHHVAFVLSVSGGMVHVIGGNQSDAVTLASYSTSNVMGYRRAA